MACLFFICFCELDYTLSYLILLFLFTNFVCTKLITIAKIATPAPSARSFSTTLPEF